jgi:hypothetical protein
MPILPSFYATKDGARPWSVTLWAAGGAALGVVAAAFKALGPLTSAPMAASVSERFAAKGLEIAAAAVVFALLCAAVAVLRNFVARRLIWPNMP